MFERLVIHRISVIQYRLLIYVSWSVTEPGIQKAPRHLHRLSRPRTRSPRKQFKHTFPAQLSPAGRSKKAFRNSTHPQLPESKSFSPSCAANIHKKKRFHRCSRQSMVSSVSFSSAGVTQWKNSLAGPHNSSRHFWTMSDCVLLMIFSLPKGSKIHTDYVRDPRCNRCTVASLLLKQNSSCHLGVFTCCFWLALNPTTSRFPRMHWPS